MIVTRFWRAYRSTRCWNYHALMGSAVKRVAFAAAHGKHGPSDLQADWPALGFIVAQFGKKGRFARCLRRLLALSGF